MMSKGNKHSARRPWVREQSVCKFHKAKKKPLISLILMFVRALTPQALVWIKCKKTDLSPFDKLWLPGRKLRQTSSIKYIFYSHKLNKSRYITQ